MHIYIHFKFSVFVWCQCSPPWRSKCTAFPLSIQLLTVAIWTSVALGNGKNKQVDVKTPDRITTKGKVISGRQAVLFFLYYFCYFAQLKWMRFVNTEQLEKLMRKRNRRLRIFKCVVYLFVSILKWTLICQISQRPKWPQAQLHITYQ